MARSNTNENGSANGAVAPLDYANLADSAIYMSVDGYIGILPMVSHDALSPAENAALNEGRKQIALRKAQTVANNAKKNGKDIREAVNAFLAGFSPDSEMQFQTIGGKRVEIAREMLAKRFEAMGKPALAATARKPDGVVKGSDGVDLLPGFMAKYASEIAAELSAWAQAYTAPTKRGEGTKAETTAEGVSLDSL